VKVAVDQIIAMRAADPDGLSRTMSWSFGLHITVIALLLIVPRHWIATDRTPPETMRINLGAGTPGPRSTGQTPTGRRAVEEAVPEPPRPDPIPPSVQRPEREPETSPTAPPKPTPPPPEVNQPTAPLARPPATGQRVQSGTSPVETGSRTDAPGLTFGGGGGMAMVDPETCFCEGYLSDMLARIQSTWNATLGNGDTIMQYTINKDGSIDDLILYRSSGNTMLDIEARRTLMAIRLPPLPIRYPDDTIVVRLTFPFRR
jgi:outer membrane biosynthesis protein TonB